jgi:uncharacterized repeat protein (TIGR01451 family)
LKKGFLSGLLIFSVFLATVVGWVPAQADTPQAPHYFGYAFSDAVHVKASVLADASLSQTTVQVDNQDPRKAMAKGVPISLRIAGSGPAEIPFIAYSEAPPGGTAVTPTTSSSFNQPPLLVQLLNATANTGWNGVSGSGKGDSTLTNVQIQNVLSAATIQTDSVSSFDPNNGMTSEASFHLGVLTISNALQVLDWSFDVKAAASGQPGGARVTSAIAPVLLSIQGQTVSLPAGQSLTIPGVAEISLGALQTTMTADGSLAAAKLSGLHINLLGDAGVTVDIGRMNVLAEYPVTPQMSIQKVATADSVLPGGTITYHIVYNNLTDQPINDAEVIDPLPSYTSFSSASNGGSLDTSRNAVVWELGTIPPHGGGILTLVLTVSSSAPPGAVIGNTVTIRAPGIPSGSGSTTVTAGGAEHMPFVAGYPDHTFLPAHPIERAEVATMVARFMNLQGLYDPGQSPGFQDVAPSYWGFKYIQVCQKEGIFKGYPDGTFHPSQPITRAEMAAVTNRIHSIRAVEFNRISSHPPQTFRDVPPDYWAYNDIETAYELGYLEGYPDGTFRPDHPTSRADSVILFDRALGRGPLVDGQVQVIQHFSDVPRSSDLFPWIEEAAWSSHIGVHGADGNEHLIQYRSTQPTFW